LNLAITSLLYRGLPGTPLPSKSYRLQREELEAIKSIDRITHHFINQQSDLYVFCYDYGIYPKFRVVRNFRTYHKNYGRSLFYGFGAIFARKIIWHFYLMGPYRLF
jgi:hypothetical protein